MNSIAQGLRHNMTDAEKLLWKHLRLKQLQGHKFRRQHRLGYYVVDFVCLRENLIIELDGGQHAEQMENDLKRSAWLEKKGFRILRFWNHEVLNETKAVLEKIMSELSPHLDPPPSESGGRKFGAMVVSLLLVFFSNLSFAADLPPTKDAIAFSRLTNGYWQIWTVDPDGNNLIQRTFSPKDKRKPVWKPGEDKILYHTSNNEVFEFDLTTQEEKQLLPELGQITDLTFSPDGKTLVFARFDSNVKDKSNLWLYDLESKELTLLIEDPGFQYSPRFSPDGTKIVFVYGQGWRTHDLWLYTLKSKAKKRLTDNDAYDLMPEFSPDGATIACASSRTGNYDIWLINADGSNPRRITKPLGVESFPSWSPKGDRLAIASQRGGSLQIWLINIEGKDWKQLTFGDDESREPAWRK